MLTKTLIFCVFMTIVNARIHYTRESYTLKGKPCVTDCINSHCIVDRHKKTDKCTVGKAKSWKYHSFQTLSHSKSKFCLSKCGKFGDPFDWCFVSDTQWDYCNPEKHIHVEHDKVLTISGVQCDNSCRGKNNVLECKNIWGKIERCVNEPVSYVVSKSRSGNNCPGTCRKGRNEDYSSCFTAPGKKENCAAPARNYDELRDAMRTYVRTYLHSNVHRRKHNPNDRTSFTRDYIKSLKYTKGLTYRNFDSNHHSVYSYAMMPGFYYDEPFLPLYVKARVTRKNIPQPNSRTEDNAISLAAKWNVRLMGKIDNRKHNNDQNGHLIAYQLGGPRDVYNFVPQTEYLNRGIPTGGDTFTASPWHNFENDIKNVVKRKGGYVELTIAVVYEDDFLHNPRPRGFTVTQERFDRKRHNYYSVYDAYYSNYQSDGLYG